MSAGRRRAGRGGPAHARTTASGLAPGSGGDRALAVLVGMTFTAAALVVLLVVHEVWVSSWYTAIDQRRASDTLDARWSGPGSDSTEPAWTAGLAAGTPLAKLRIPALGDNWEVVVVEGVDERELAIGPGHYPGTAGPGQDGNLAIAGHRVGRGAPFDGLGTLDACAAVELETGSAVHTYRVLPWPGSPLADTPECHQLAPVLADASPTAEMYRRIPGREIVSPGELTVIDPVPNEPDVAAPAGFRLLTLTTCHPRFSARQRLVVHAALVSTRPSGPPNGDERAARPAGG